MTTYNYLEITENETVATVWLNRPEVRNAFHEGLISEITRAFEELAKKDLRLVVLRGKGPTFCAGADLNWMRNVADYSLEQNQSESRALSTCFATIYQHPHPTLALVHGAAIGGANGLIASCDLAYAEEDAVFSLSEVKIGIVPACISPYIIKRIGEFNSRELMISGRRISGVEATQKQLINGYVPKGGLDEKAHEITQQILGSGPQAVKMVKKLIYQACNEWTYQESQGETAEMIAHMRGTPEAQEGMQAFLQKRTPNWVAQTPSN